MSFLQILRNWFARSYTIEIPRTHAPGSGNALGAGIASNRCPLCKDRRGFYRGRTPSTLYCGNPACRMGFSVINYGPGRIAAQLTERGPDHLYYQGWGQVSGQSCSDTRRETIPDEI